jgi:HDOD domain
MISWLAYIFGLSPPKVMPRTHVLEEILELEETLHPPLPMPDGLSALDSAAVEFLLSLLCPKDTPVSLYDLPHHEREFLASNMRRLHRREFEIPLLPEATLRIQQLLANPEACLKELADIFKNDPTLSAELLCLANSSYLASASCKA